jgi:hypothetical protein
MEAEKKIQITSVRGTPYRKTASGSGFPAQVTEEFICD